MKIAIMVEGKTEKAFMPHLRAFLQARLAGNMPKLDPVPYDGRIPKEEKLKRCVENLLSSGLRPADAVIALTDVYTGTNDFTNANDAKTKMQSWVRNERFHPHAAQHDFEAWLLPYWPKIQRLAGSNRTPPHGHPESVNHNNPPSRRLNEVFLNGERRTGYVKVRDGSSILRDADLSVAINACPELKAFVNTIITLCGAPPIP
jgi:hypothetical protein